MSTVSRLYLRCVLSQSVIWKTCGRDCVLCMAFRFLASLHAVFLPCIQRSPYRLLRTRSPYRRRTLHELAYDLLICCPFRVETRSPYRHYAPMVAPPLGTRSMSTLICCWPYFRLECFHFGSNSMYVAGSAFGMFGVRPCNCNVSECALRHFHFCCMDLLCWRFP